MDKYKEDWEDARERMAAWWNGEIIDRICINVKAPKRNSGARKVLLPEENLEKRWTDADYLIQRYEEEFKNTFYGGEAFPKVHLLCTLLGGALGRGLIYQKDTIWIKPLSGTLDSSFKLKSLYLLLYQAYWEWLFLLSF